MQLNPKIYILSENTVPDNQWDKNSWFLLSWSLSLNTIYIFGVMGHNLSGGPNQDLKKKKEI